ncbi:hypothetical protein BD289DRAFT_277535 [Coniella lustricola]|uniref:Uncharacterized protein n=1 Tax=Coniella lustricola TaxID=2025994 RepID=A0A2T3A6I1_9PEZI|nr:hypothetical protein BD289DRAFT_277535 [Coniella lustricola]
MRPRQAQYSNETFFTQPATPALDGCRSDYCFFTLFVFFIFLYEAAGDEESCNTAGGYPKVYIVVNTQSNMVSRLLQTCTVTLALMAVRSQGYCRHSNRDGEELVTSVLKKVMQTPLVAMFSLASLFVYSLLSLLSWVSLVVSSTVPRCRFRISIRILAKLVRVDDTLVFFQRRAHPCTHGRHLDGFFRCGLHLQA